MTAGAPLAGRRILVTRPAGDAEGLAGRLREAGGQPVCVPTLEIEPLADYTDLHAVAARLDEFRLAIFVSRNAVRLALQHLSERRAGRPWPASLRVAAVGAGTRRELEARGFAGAIAPAGQADSEALLALPELQAVRGLNVALFRGEGGRTLLADTLVERGAIVAQAPCYRRTRPANEAALRAAWPVDAIAVSSAEGLANLVAMLGPDAARRVGESALFVPHSRVAQAAAQLGLGEARIGGPGDAEMAAAMVAYFSDAS